MDIERILSNNLKLDKEVENIINSFQQVITLRGRELLTYAKLNIEDLKEVDISDNEFKTRYVAGEYYFDCGINDGSLYIDKIKKI